MSRYKVYHYNEQDFVEHRSSVIALMQCEGKSFNNEARVRDYFCSRMALMELLETDDWSKLEIDKSWKLVHYPNVHSSISHSKDVGAAVISSEHQVGIDIEWKSRNVKEASSKFFVKEGDHFETEDLLFRWVIKEACFKSFKNEHVKNLNDINILSSSEYGSNNQTGTYNHHSEGKCVLVTSLLSKT